MRLRIFFIMTVNFAYLLFIFIYLLERGNFLSALIIHTTFFFLHTNNKTVRLDDNLKT